MVYPPPLFKSVRFPRYAWNAIFLKSTLYEDVKSDVYTMFPSENKNLDNLENLENLEKKQKKQKNPKT